MKNSVQPYGKTVEDEANERRKKAEEECQRKFLQCICLSILCLACTYLVCLIVVIIVNIDDF